MTTKLYRKAFAGIALAVSLLITGAVKAEASPDNVSSDLSEIGVISSSPDLLLGSSDVVSNLVNRSVSSSVNPVAGFSHSSETTASTVAQTSLEMAQGLEIAQDGVSPVDGTFAPLTDEELRQQLLINPSFVPETPRPSPATSFGTPTAFGADWGDAFVGLSGVTQGDTDTKADGSISLGMGFGDAVNNVGVEVSVGIISLDGFGDDGSIGVKLHKIFPEAENLAIALGWSNPITWGDANDAEDTFYGVVTRQFDLNPDEDSTLPLTVSLGAGTGVFRSTGAIEAGDNALNVFGSLGLRIIPEVSLLSSWTGSGLGLGVSAAPFDFPLVFTAGVSDVTGNTRSGARVNASAGYSFGF